MQPQRLSVRPTQQLLSMARWGGGIDTSTTAAGQTSCTIHDDLSKRYTRHEDTHDVDGLARRRGQALLMLGE